MSEIRKCFTSRFEKGMLMEVDFSQLEVAALAFLTQDQQMMQDIHDDLDMHLVSASWVSGKDYDYLKHLYDKGDASTIKLRKESKRPRFELQYGAGAKTIAENNKWPIKKAKDYIARYYARYPQVKEWQEDVANQVEYNARIKTGWVSASAAPPRTSYYRCPHTNRRYVFNTYPDKRTGDHKFSPTQMKNYPVQGFATADLVPTVLGELVNRIYKSKMEDSILLVNTVHDSVLLDIENVYSKGFAIGLIVQTFGNAVEIMKECYDIDINVPIRYSIETGPNWAEMEKVELKNG